MNRSRKFPFGLVLFVTTGALIVHSDALADPPPSPFLERAIVAEAVRRAIAHAGLLPEHTRDLANRARMAGMLPHVSVRVVRGLGASTAQTVSVSDSACIQTACCNGDRSCCRSQLD